MCRSILYHNYMYSTTHRTARAHGTAHHQQLRSDTWHESSTEPITVAGVGPGRAGLDEQPQADDGSVRNR